jgi:hypothetical protein
MSEPKITEVVYRSGTHLSQSWDVIQVVYRYDDPDTGAKRPADSFTIARAADGAILRKTDIVLDRWEIITDEEDLRFYRRHFDERDRLAAEQRAKGASA